MDAGAKLTVITIGGVVISFVGIVLSQLWRSSTETDGKTLRRVTPVGWLLLGLSLVSLLGSIGSELLRVDIGRTEARERENKERERRVDDDRKSMNARQEIIENSIRQSTEIIVAGQPLTTLTLSLRIMTSDQELSKKMIVGRARIDENSRDVQGGVPSTPFEAMEVIHSIVPLLSHVARSGDRSTNPHASDAAAQPGTFALMRLSTNATLSFGLLSPNTKWLGRGGRERISAGFAGGSLTGTRPGYSTPWITTDAATNLSQASPSYELTWNLDPLTLWASVDRTNPDIPMTAMLPKTIQFAVFYDAKVLPFARNDFGRVAGENFWAVKNRPNTELAWADPNTKVTLQLEVNGAQEKVYGLKGRHRVSLIDENGDELEDANCTILRFESVSSTMR